MKALPHLFVQEPTNDGTETNDQTTSDVFTFEPQKKTRITSIIYTVV